MQGTMKGDHDVDHQITKPADFNPVDPRSTEDLSNIWGEIKTKFLDARDRGRDENAWRNDVFRPLLRLAIKLHDKGR